MENSWQERVKEFRTPLFRRGNLGHAFLFGERGTGKFAAGIDLVMSLYAPPVKTALAGSESCRKIRNYAHPDFHADACYGRKSIARTELSDAGWQHISKRH